MWEQQQGGKVSIGPKGNRAPGERVLVCDEKRRGGINSFDLLLNTTQLRSETISDHGHDHDQIKISFALFGKGGKGKQGFRKNCSRTVHFFQIEQKKTRRFFVPF